MTVTYSLQVSDPQAVKDMLTTMYGRRAEFAYFDLNKSLVVTAPFDVQKEVDGIASFLEQLHARQAAATPRADGIVGMYLNARDPGTAQNPAVDLYLSTTFSAGTSAVAALVEKIRTTKSDQEKAATRAALRQVLHQNFDADMAARQAKLAEIEARVSTLRSQIAARTQAKERIIALHQQVLENEAAGLGFPQVRSDDAARYGGAKSMKPTAAEAFRGYINNLLEVPRAESNEDHLKAQQKTATLQPLGRWASSPDRTMYAYLDDESKSTTPRQAILFVVNARGGDVVARAVVNIPCGPLEFTAQGVGTRERDGSFKQVVSVAPPRASGESTGDWPAGATGPRLLSATELRELLLSQLNGAWVCVAAEAGDKKYAARDVWPWELRLDIANEKVAISYIGEDLRRNETKGDFLLDMKANPPRFIIEAQLAAWVEKSRLGGQAAIDHGRLRIVSLGEPMPLNAVNRKDAPPLTALEFAREKAATEPRTTDAAGPPTAPPAIRDTPPAGVPEIRPDSNAPVDPTQKR